MNKAGQNVVIKSSDGTPEKGWTVKKNFMMDITKGTQSAQPMTLVASSADVKNTPLTLNGTLELPLKPHSTKAVKDVLIIGTQQSELCPLRKYREMKGEGRVRRRGRWWVFPLFKLSS